MSKHYSLWVLMLGLMSAAWGQDNSTPQPGAVVQDSGQAPVPAYGQEPTGPPLTVNPPLSGLDMPGLEPHAAPLSYLQAGVVVSETADTNVTDNLGQSAAQSVTQALGSLTLQRLWSNYALALDYLGGVAYFNASGVGWKQLQQFDLEQRVTWKRGQLAIRDSFSYLPEGNFGAAYGAVGTQGITSIGASNFVPFSSATLAALGEVSRIMNLTLVDVSESLTPKSAVTAAAGYAFTHFTGNPVLGSVPLVNNSFLGSSQVTVQAGYNRILRPRDQVALVYYYQGFDFSAQGLAFHTHVIQAMYGHRISGRMDFLISAGPQITVLSFGGATNNRVGVAGRGLFRYRFPKTMLELSYDRYETSGAGFFAGAQSDVGQMTVSRPLNRVWTGYVNAGYSHNQRVQPLAANAVLANTFNYGFAGVGVRRVFGRTLTLFGAYQYNQVSFDNTFCLTQGVSTCNRSSKRQLATIGLEWTPRPMRID